MKTTQQEISAENMKLLWHYEHQLQHISDATQLAILEFDKAEDGSKKKQEALDMMGRLAQRRRAVEELIDNEMARIEDPKPTMHNRNVHRAGTLGDTAADTAEHNAR